MNIGDIDNPYQIIYQNPLIKILKLIFKEIKMSMAILTKIDKSCFNNKSDLVVLSNII